MKAKRKAIWTLALAILEWVVLLCVYDSTFLPYRKDYSTMGTFVFFPCMILGIALLYWNTRYICDARFWIGIKKWVGDDDDWLEYLNATVFIETEEPSQFGKTLTATGILVFMIFLILERSLECVSVTYSTDILIGHFRFSKRYLVFPVAFILFPLILQNIFREMKESGEDRNRLLLGWIQIVILTIITCLHFMKVSFFDLVSLAMIEAFTVCAGIRKYLWGNENSKKDVLLSLGVYIIMWLVLLCICYHPYRDSFFVHPLYDSTDWVAASIVTTLYVLFLIQTRKLLGKSAMGNRNWLVYSAAFLHLAIQTIGGTLYALEIMPYPVSLPFTGDVGLIIDTIAFALLLSCGWEERDNFESPVLTLVHGNKPAQES